MIFGYLCKDEDGVHLLDYEPDAYRYEWIRPIVYQEVSMFRSTK